MCNPLYKQQLPSRVAWYDRRIAGLGQQLDHRRYINGLIEQRSRELTALGQAPGSRISGLTGIQKTLYYGKSKMQVWKQVASEPSAAEEQALEYLQGAKGFSFHTSGTGNGMEGAQSEADLEKMGFQTKRQLQERTQQQFGNGLSGVQDKLGGQVQDWQGKTKELSGKVRDAKQQVSSVRSDLSEAKRSLQTAKQVSGESFKPNPMRGLPFRKRIEKGYNFQTSRATPDGKRPAMLELAGTIAFKHTPKLNYGIGISTAFGLGKDWSNIRLSHEGAGLRGFVQHELFFGISAYGGYERFYRSGGNRRRLEETRTAILPYNERNTPAYSEAVLLGLTKQYKINAKRNGAVQVLYDVWWKEKGLNSPLVIRIVNTQ